ncbi:spore coat protein [Sutcliffiella cohnii]|uniref:Spore coat protein n=1 Tax=Sutcliffiella cohnii TaxID=33932 RepID=A0A223KL60_9BACI|nr:MULTISPECIES: spore coat protein [Sutcliffiella]AST90221.1 spore coat protein [Sutcliffiella cohnii]WBL15872.1 spore coat protein [Sutcliffiella sp. NC1]
MNNIIKKLMGMGGMTDTVIATDFLVSTKAAVRNLAFAITETTTPELKKVLREELRNAVKTHEAISNYMIKKGVYHPSNLEEQIKVDMQITETALTLTEK